MLSVWPRRRPVPALPEPRGHLPAGLFSAWRRPGRRPALTRSSRRGCCPGRLRLAGAAGEAARPPWVEVGQAAGAGAGARRTRGARWLQTRGAPAGGRALRGDREARSGSGPQRGRPGAGGAAGAWLAAHSPSIPRAWWPFFRPNRGLRGREEDPWRPLFPSCPCSAPSWASADVGACGVLTDPQPPGAVAGNWGLQGRPGHVSGNSAERWAMPHLPISPLSSTD